MVYAAHEMPRVHVPRSTQLAAAPRVLVSARARQVRHRSAQVSGLRSGAIAALGEDLAQFIEVLDLRWPLASEREAGRHCLDAESPSRHPPFASVPSPTDQVAAEREERLFRDKWCICHR